MTKNPWLKFRARWTQLAIRIPRGITVDAKQSMDHSMKSNFGFVTWGIEPLQKSGLGCERLCRTRVDSGQTSTKALICGGFGQCPAYPKFGPWLSSAVLRPPGSESDQCDRGVIENLLTILRGRDEARSVAAGRCRPLWESNKGPAAINLVYYRESGVQSVGSEKSC